MICRDYTQELGLKSNRKMVPLPIAIAIFVFAGAGIWFGVAKFNLHPSGKQANPEMTVAKPPAGNP